MTRKIFIWVAHPKAKSLCGAMADAYEAGARENGAEIRRLNLSDMEFDTHFEGFGPDMPALEPDLLKWQESITWADHIMIIHPYWWGAMPTRAKAVLDRGLSPGFAFKYHEGGTDWDRLLEGRTADGIITADTPTWMDTLLYRMPGRRVLKNQVLKFCGFKVRKIRQFGSITLASPEKITRWIDEARRMGVSAA